jgi:uncharacterized protein
MATSAKTITEAIENTGFPLWSQLIHVFVGGSELHGAKVKDTDDLDIYGTYIEQPESALGLDSFEHYVWSSAGSDRRNGPDDIDVTLYSLRKWAGLATKGNPTALHFLFAENVVSQRTGAVIWETCIRRNTAAFVSKHSGKQFVGFVDAMLGRLQGLRGRGKKGHRAPVEEQFGYDVKAGMHAIRLLHEGIELMRHGVITLPRPERDLLIHIRTGGWSLEKLLNEAKVLLAELNAATASSNLPDFPDRRRVSGLVADAYLQYWPRM